MMRTSRLLLSLVLASPALAAVDAPPAATIETTLSTASDHIRQFAFDGDADTFFASAQNAGKADHFTLVFPKPVTVKSITVVTGRPDGDDALDAGTLEGSDDHATFTELAKFENGRAHVEPRDRTLRAVRIQPRTDLDHPLAIREITIEADPAVAVFKYPIEFSVDVSDAPDMKDWADKTARECERVYPLFCELLKSEGYKPAHHITMALKTDYRGVAATGGTRITGSVKYFKDHPQDVGAMVHESIHVIQRYRGRGNPGWLVEGLDDYLRFFIYEPGNLGPIRADRAHYNSSYRVTAAFLAYVIDKYEKDSRQQAEHAHARGNVQGGHLQGPDGQDPPGARRGMAGHPVEEVGWLMASACQSLSGKPGLSPEGAAVNSPGRQPWVERGVSTTLRSPAGATDGNRWPVGPSVAPSGLSEEDHVAVSSSPGLTPWAIHCRPFGAKTGLLG